VFPVIPGEAPLFSPENKLFRIPRLFINFVVRLQSFYGIEKKERDGKEEYFESLNLVSVSVNLFLAHFCFIKRSNFISVGLQHEQG
jgi:hypothetical protein